MRQIMTVCVVVLLGSVGCQTGQNCARSGLHIEYFDPPTINTSTPVLLTPSSTITGAHPMGTLAGPVTEGKSTHGPAQSILPIPMPMQMPSLKKDVGDCGPNLGAARLSCEEWCQIMSQMSAKPVPTAR